MPSAVASSVVPSKDSDSLSRSSICLRGVTSSITISMSLESETGAILTLK